MQQLLKLRESEAYADESHTVVHGTRRLVGNLADREHQYAKTPCNCRKHNLSNAMEAYE